MKISIKPYSPAGFLIATAVIGAIYGVFYLLCVILANIYL